MNCPVALVRARAHAAPCAAPGGGGRPGAHDQMHVRWARERAATGQAKPCWCPLPRPSQRPPRPPPPIPARGENKPPVRSQPGAWRGGGGFGPAPRTPVANPQENTRPSMPPRTAQQQRLERVVMADLGHLCLSLRVSGRSTHRSPFSLLQATRPVAVVQLHLACRVGFSSWISIRCVCVCVCVCPVQGEGHCEL